MNAVMQSTCSKCGIAKPSEAFNFRLDRGYQYRQCRDCMADRKWGKKNPAKLRAKVKEWEKKNPDRLRAIWREMAARKRARPEKRVHGRISSQIWNVLRGLKQYRPTFALLGYSRDELMAHLERQFARGMGWHNMGEWHIDHIVPLASFKITSADDPELKRAWALTNLRPLWAEDNIRKRASNEFLL